LDTTVGQIVDLPVPRTRGGHQTQLFERLFGEVKRRSHKMAAAFRKEESCVLLFYAVIRSLKFNKLTMPSASQKQPGSELLPNT
jgi:hypothetical protein